jgi:tetratricopeptide (TPR) repeat protein
MHSWLAALRPRRSPATPYERGVAALDAGRHEEALAEFESALTAATVAAERAAAHNKRGVTLVALGERDAALADFCTALALDERYAPALVNLGNLLLEEGHARDAIDYYEAAIRADEKYAVAYRNLGIAHKRIGQRAESVHNLRTANRLEMRNPPKRFKP